MNIFIHYLDRELLDIYVTGKYSEQTLKKVKFSIKLALLLIGQDEYVYIPASNYFESNLAQRALEDFGDIIDLNYIRLVSSSSTLKGFVKKKEKVYPSYYTKEQVLEEREKILEKNVPGIWTPRKNSATLDIISDWNNNVDSTLWSGLYTISKYRKIDSFEKDMAEIPKRLAQKAFIVNYVYPKLKISSENEDKAKEIINKVITQSYINSFLKEFNAVCYKDIFLLPQANDILPTGYDHISYEKICRKLVSIPYNGQSLYSYIDDCKIDKLLLWKEKEIIHDLFEHRENKNIIMPKEKTREKMRTFIVHGHDEEAKLSLKNYIQNTLKMEEPVILAEKASKGLTIIEKFEEYAKECKLIFVLLTPDDKYTDNNNYRARQNVIFEMGYFLGKLGRKSGQIILLYKGKLELPNDISGIIYINIDNGIEAAGEQIRREIENLEEQN